MNENEAREWVASRVQLEALAHLNQFVAWVIEENSRQNLISPTTIALIWQRHVADSLQLLDLARGANGPWLDIGSGGGFPGMVLAIAGARPMLLVEPRKRRAAFLQACVDRLGLEEVTVAPRPVEQVMVEAGVITARAVASVEKLLQAAAHCCTPATRWLLPRGSAGLDNLAVLAASVKMVFHVEQSLTEPRSSIVLLDGCP